MSAPEPIAEGVTAVLDELSERDQQRGALGRHTVMLGALVLMLFALPVLDRAPGRGVRFPLLFCLVLLAAIYVNRTQRWILWLAVALGVGAAGGIAIEQATDVAAARIAADLLGVTLLAFTTLVLLNTLVRARSVELDTIVGGICVYLLVGVCYALVFRLVIDLDPGAIERGGVALAVSTTDGSALPAQLLYFSLITLTTVGYGDIMPRSELAQMLCASEAIMGQLYLAIFIARLMALYLTNGPSRRGEDRGARGDR